MIIHLWKLPLGYMRVVDTEYMQNHSFGHEFSSDYYCDLSGDILLPLPQDRMFKLDDVVYNERTHLLKWNVYIQIT